MNAGICSTLGDQLNFKVMKHISVTEISSWGVKNFYNILVMGTFALPMTALTLVITKMMSL